MKNTKIKLRTKITMLNIIVVFIALILTVIFMSQLRVSWIRKDTEINLMNISKIVSKSPLVVEALKNNDNKEKVQAYVKSVINSSKNIDSLIVMDLSGNSYGNSEFQNIPIGKDIDIYSEAAIQNGDNLNDMIQSFGKLIICFVPIKDGNNVPVGFVVSKVLTSNLEVARYEIMAVLLMVIFSGLLIGSVGALIISNSVKSSLLGYEAEQISKLFVQKQEVLDTLEEGIIAVDEKFKITFYNKGAINILKIKDEDIIGKDIFKIIPNSNLGKIFVNGEAQYNKEMLIKDTVILTNRIPIMKKDKIIGAVAIFRDKTELTRLAEELTGVKQVVEALRANNHEFMNKLHVILGLIQIGELEEAKKYILNQTKIQQQKVSLVMNKIEDATIAALMLGKISRAKEMGVELIINPNSNIKRRRGRINSHVLVTIIGNLLENAMEAVSSSEKDEKNVEILIDENEKEILVEVKDTGVGIKKENIPSIFDKGFSTKGSNRGRGLPLLKQIVENLDGKVEVLSEEEVGTKFIVQIPKGDKND
ncbi:Sensor histidine kinase DcuS [Clostridium liquoris]|jgi:sensor histidine kinase regulating citrate/malate metabolism|uniref:histidine kinase n=1 Tax=Clostridium liquoris TaxID=1289519 RepID=A0A2T0B5J5_9CLOT|nr:sensor histidine kinase [Clostridium liquoris]PRR79145.1 Sensor histidine kinase DcuS [Clostridium liquoris]